MKINLRAFFKKGKYVKMMPDDLDIIGYIRGISCGNMLLDPLFHLQQVRSPMYLAPPHCVYNP